MLRRFKESRIRKAAGEAEAIREVAKAKAKEIEMVYESIKNANPDDTLVQLKSLEALKEVAKGEANKVFIPFEATSALASLGSIKEVMKDEKKAKIKIGMNKATLYIKKTEDYKIFCFFIPLVQNLLQAHHLFYLLLFYHLYVLSSLLTYFYLLFLSVLQVLQSQLLIQILLNLILYV